MKWLHISDIHFNIRGYDSEKIKEKLISKLEELNYKLDFILITGDCLYQYDGGNKEQKETINYIKKIANICGCSNKKVYICQGNHDVNRNDNERNKLIESIRKKKADFSASYQKLCEFGNEKFQNIHKGVTSYNYEAYKIFAFKNESYRIISLNSSLISKDKKDCQKLRMCNEKLYEIGKKINNDDKINILIMHHGIECIEPEDARKFEHWVEDSNIDIVFCGHTHRAAVETYNDIFRDVKQFTAGAIVMDDYAIPSFFICETNDARTGVTVQLYTYAKKMEDWALDNQHLRKFKDGKYFYNLSRREQKDKENDNVDILKCKTTIDKFNLMYIEKFGDGSIYSNKYEGKEEFNSWKIVHSLVEVGVSYIHALELTKIVMNKITNQDFKSIDIILSCQELRSIVYETIVHYNTSDIQSELEISCWASRYARRYSRDTEIMVIKKYGAKEKLNYSYIKNILLKEVLDSITGNTIFYEKIFRNELTRMAERVLNFLKNMGIFEIRDKALSELIKEYITQNPHPWLVNNNRESLVAYHKEQGEQHIFNLNNDKKDQVIISQMEAAYHICAAFLVQYDDYIGCTETSPIIILTRTINCMTNKINSGILPMQKYQIIQLKKDLEIRGINFTDFKRNINILNNNIVVHHKITMQETKEALVELWGMLRKLGQESVVAKKQEQTTIEGVMNIFSGAKGFIVKSPLRELTNCFWVEPNWEEYEIKQQHLGKQLLVCVLQNVSELDNIYNYLYKQNKRETLTEIVFVLSDYSSFGSELRKSVREKFKGKYNKCVFVQEENFKQISKNRGWRDIFYELICISKIS